LPISKYRRIKYEDRCQNQIYALSKRGSSQEGIAEVLGVSQSAVSREIHRNRGERGYRFKQAEAKAQARQAIRSKRRKLTVPTRGKIEAKLRQIAQLISDNVKEMTSPTRDGRAMIAAGMIHPGATATTAPVSPAPRVTIGAVHVSSRPASSAGFGKFA
jgi:predicted transcriptional regulator